MTPREVMEAELRWGGGAGAADAILAALAAAGYAVVPREPTEAMTRAWHSQTVNARAQRVLIYRAMLAAAEAPSDAR